ncbi:hypothetical protein K227x_03050 [Rubripirellula lacrimiformis]|uniref:Peptidase C39 family protein n=1 Tax=Rubripirellula lacrimiformis TaxID=1930273 RepID=A0A517N465_9BACT|nr:peptidase C39 [Rubripirellula lacrimiformis]QDT01935.1 hypothetical protein K227x_03050 [Rubripirellula lacrimiformis]
MSDIYLAIAVMAILSLACGLGTGLYAYSTRGQRTMLCLTLAVLAGVMFLFYGSGQLLWARWIPSSAAIIYSNVTSLLAAAAAGWAMRLGGMPRWRRMILASMLAVMCLAALTWPLLAIAIRPAPQGSDQWNGAVAMQSSWATCSPAAAATLLRLNEIPVSEADLIPLCLTDRDGTPTLGLYRGLKIMSDRHDCDVEVVTQTVDQLLQSDDWPVYLAVRLPYGVEDRRYVEQWGWIPGMGHSVVLMGKQQPDIFVVGDPSVGAELWTEADLRQLWHGDGLRIRRRSGPLR